MDGIWSARRHGYYIECLTSKGKKYLKSYTIQQQQQQLLEQKLPTHQVNFSEPHQKPVQVSLAKDHNKETPPTPILRRNQHNQVPSVTNDLAQQNGNITGNCRRRDSNQSTLTIPRQESAVRRTVTFTEIHLKSPSGTETQVQMACDSIQGQESYDSSSAFTGNDSSESRIECNSSSGYVRVEDVEKSPILVDTPRKLSFEKVAMKQRSSEELDEDERGSEEDKMIVISETVKIRPKRSLGEWRCRGGGLSVRWSGVSVSVAGKTLVSEVSGHCDPGHIFAVMGPSGSGKTTLLNALSGRVRCEGSVWLGERPLSRKLRHLVGYSTQHDLFHPHLRLRQMLQFTAELRLPHAMSQAQKVAAVDAVIDLLGLQHCQETIIGDATVRGLSGGERKRASIACELLTDPPVLVLDEPTSGLDAHAAHSLIANLKALAVQEGRAVVLSLHQPSSRIFHMLDTVLLLAKGQPAYLGPSGDVAPYMAQLGLPIQPNYNPADFLLEVATEYSERLIRHYSETHRPGNVVRQSKNPPPWVFHQRLSSLSASQSKPILRTDVDDEDASSSHERLDVGQELPDYRDLQYSRLTNANGYPHSVVIDVPDERLTQRLSNVQRCACGNIVQLSLDVLPSVDGENHCSEIISSPYPIDFSPSSTVRFPSEIAVSNLDYESSAHLFVCDDCIKMKNHQHLIHDGRDRDLVDSRGGLDLGDDDSEHHHDLQRSSSFRGFNVIRSLPAPLSEDACLNKGPGRPTDEAPRGTLPDTRTTRSVKRDESDSGRESCSSDHSDVASCSAASVAPFASSRRHLRLYAADARWPASYWTQCRVLTARCFAVYRPIITSRVNWVQTLGFALLAGVLWYQAPRTEEGITDLQGWMFFSTSYWMMHSHFQALNTFPREKAVLEKERGSGWYRISAYYIAKTLSELPLTVALPSLYFIISYPLMAGVSNSLVMLLLLLMLLLNALVAQSVGLLVSVTFSDIEHCWAVSALITLFQQLFGGFLSTRVPPWMEWARYLSMVQYAYTNMCYIEFSMGLPVACAAELSRYPSCASGNSTVVPVAEILASSGVSGSSIGPSVVWMNTAALVLYLVVARLLTYLVLRYRYRPKY